MVGVGVSEDGGVGFGVNGGVYVGGSGGWVFVGVVVVEEVVIRILRIVEIE